MPPETLTTRRSSTAPEKPVHPSRDDPFVTDVSELVGGPVGRHVLLAERRFWTPVRVLLALTLVACVLGWLQKSPCRDGGWRSQFQYTHMCYSDVYALYFSYGLDEGERPYLDSEVEYPVLTGGLMQAAATLARVFPEDDRPKAYVDITVLLLAAYALVATVAISMLAGRRRQWDAAMFALAPGLVLAGFINWDLPAVALSCLGLVAWARRRPVWAGVFLGLAIAAKFYPVLLVVGLLPLCLRAGRLKEWAATAAVSAASFAVVCVPIWLAAGDNVERFYSGYIDRGADLGSLWYVLQLIREKPLGGVPAEGAAPDALNAAVAVTFLLLLAAVILLVLRAPRRPRVAQVLFLVVAAFLVANKGYAPQHVLWLLPLAVLARPRWLPFLGWQLAEVVGFVATWLHLMALAKPGEGVPNNWYVAFVLIRVAALVAFSVTVVRDVLHPEQDVVRRDGVDDPAGGVLEDGPARSSVLTPA